MTTRTKICGITRLEDALHAAEAGAAFLGYIFYAPSRRFIAPRSAKDIIAQVRKVYPGVLHVGVFVDEEPSNMVWIRNLAGLDLLQLHGSETPEICRELELHGIDVIKVLPMSAGSPATDYRTYDVPYYLCDTHDPALKGGTGRTFDLSRIPLDLPRDRTFLAGGLTPENVGEMVSQVQPYCVDVSTGVEDSPGIKSSRRVSEFIKAVSSAGESASVKGKQ